jgi:signal transduction histidine kinase
MPVLLLFDLLIAFALISIGLLVALRDWRPTVNRLYFAMACFTACWIVSNYISNNTGISLGAAVLANKLVLLFPGLTLTSFLGFVIEFTAQRRKKDLQTLNSLLVAIFILALTPLVVQGVAKEGNLYTIDFGPLAIVYFAGILVTASLGFYLLLRDLSRTTGVERQKRLVIFWSLLVTTAVNIFTNVGLPFLHGSYDLTKIGPLSAVFIVLGSAYAIIKHRLFDIRTFVLRAVTYVFSTILLSLVFILPVVLIVAAITQVHFTWGRLIWGVLGATVFALFYNRVRIAFDNLTNRIFFRGYYEPQDVINQLSEALVYSVNAEQIERHSKRILNKAIKAGKFDFWLMDTAGSGVDRPAELHSLGELFHGRASSNVCITAEQPAGSKLAAFLREQDTAALIRLRAGSTTLGFMALGFKESGEAFSLRDRQLLNIASNEIAIALQDALHFEEIQHFNRTLQERVQKATRELKHSNEKLRALDETKDEFITMASHQLRTPLTSVKGYLSMVLEGDAGKLNAQQTKMLQQSYVSAQRMVYLIADLLNLSRLNTGKFVIESTPTDLVEVVQSEVDQLIETARSRDVKLTFRPPANFPILLLDETKIHQVVMNFIDNAIYYTPAGGSIDVELKDDGANIEYLVRDSGIGVPRSEQHKLFTKFYRAANAQRARPDGTGLGLFMAKKVVIAQGGVIIFESEEGKGSTFGFRFSKRHHAVAESPSSKEANVESASTTATALAK